jgi:hypothetical protein
MHAMMQLDASTADAFLTAARWSPGAKEDLTLRETLPFAYVSELAQAAGGIPLSADGKLPGNTHDRDALLALGLVCLSLGVAEWGLGGPPADLEDPQNDAWRGPPKGRGKHMVSVHDGGIGLPHLDTGELGDLLLFALSVVPQIGAAAARVNISRLATAFKRGLIYKQLDPRQQGGPEQDADWRDLTSFCEAALGVREVQHWILSSWIERYWMPSIAAVGKGRGLITDVIINARIRNSSPRNASCALGHALGTADPIQAQLDAYANKAICQDANPRHRDRFGYMRRPVVVWQRLAG